MEIEGLFMRRYIFASHYRLAYGLKDTINYITNRGKTIYDINAYIDNKISLDTQIKELFDSFSPEDEVIILADLLGGSVYQSFFPYMSNKVHVICGMNLPLAMSVLLFPDDIPFSEESINSIIDECKSQIVYVNQLKSVDLTDMEDE